MLIEIQVGPARPAITACPSTCADCWWGVPSHTPTALEEPTATPWEVDGASLGELSPLYRPSQKWSPGPNRRPHIVHMSVVVTFAGDVVFKSGPEGAREKCLGWHSYSRNSRTLYIFGMSSIPISVTFLRSLRHLEGRAKWWYREGWLKGQPPNKIYFLVWDFALFCFLAKDAVQHTERHIFKIYQNDIGLCKCFSYIQSNLRWKVQWSKVLKYVFNNINVRI